jgi:peptide chain release factor 1
LLRARLYDAELEKQQASQYSLRKNQVGTGSRSEKIRTYNFKDSRCTDHRLNQNFPLQLFLEGSLGQLHERCLADEQAMAMRALTLNMGSGGAGAATDAK